MIVTTRDKLDAVERELAYRRKVYLRLVAEGKMSGKLADWQLAVMDSIRLDYARQVDEDERLSRLL